MALTLWGLTGCATTGLNSSSQGQEANVVQVTTAAEALGNAQPGEQLVLPEDNELGVSTARVIKQYHAASGRLCRRIELATANPDIRVMCKSDSGQWRMTRSLTGASLAQPLTQTPMAAVVVGEASVDSTISSTKTEESHTLHSGRESLLDNSEAGLISDVTLVVASAKNSTIRLREVQDGETLWKFSKRVTGDALNWHDIADLNEIDDARTVVPGLVLKIPVHLIRPDSQ